MDLLVLLRSLRRHWVVLVLLTVLGGVLGVASTAFDKGSTSSRTYYRATNTMVVDMTQQQGTATANAFTSLDQVGIYTTTGAVPDAVAKELGTDESGGELAQHITTSTNGGTSTIAITAAEPSADDATRLADSFAEQLKAVLDKKSQDAYSTATDTIQKRLNDLQGQANSLYAQIAANPPNVDSLKANLQAVNNQQTLAFTSLSQLAAAGPPTTRFTELQKAAAVPIDKAEYDARLALGATSRNNLTDSGSSDALDGAIATSGGSTTISGPVARGLLGAFLGLLAGIGFALMRERLDRRIMTRAEAEAAFHLPVLAEVPQIKKSEQRDAVLVANVAPLSRFTEAFRAVRSSILFTRAAMAAQAAPPTGSRRSGNGNGSGDVLFEPDPDEPLVVMMTSASPGEGKTTSTANLAVVFAEAGSSVLVVNCDFRRPAIHRHFGIPDEPRRVHETSVPGVKVVTNVLTDPASNPAQVLAAQRQVVAAARGRFDVILLDTAPLLTANDAVELVSSADLLVLVARVGATRTDTAERSMELLNRLDVPLGGVVLMGVASASNDYYYYYQPGRVSSGASDRGRGSTARTAEADAEQEMFTPDPSPVPPRD